MGAQYYYQSGAHTSADLKRVVLRVRASRPELFLPRLIRETSMDGDGRITFADRTDVRAVAMTGKQRHTFSTKGT